ncbi:hypothetical protein POVWA2_008290 [Plasmodium ovale wallikeri]|uniref:Uncharacterized protein n=1 Tax=Plasmodium ovale wallikeri TaxID=864142 RepID=A0A1A8YKW8_PLAOA|nr:hypothetical protein POVWA2_008290 [Plasmodium ovale wallikeri]
MKSTRACTYVFGKALTKNGRKKKKKKKKKTVGKENPTGGIVKTLLYHTHPILPIFPSLPPPLFFFSCLRFKQLIETTNWGEGERREEKCTIGKGNRAPKLVSIPSEKKRMMRG